MSSLATQGAKCTAVRCHNSRIMLVRDSDGRTAYFGPGQSTLTGSVNRKGELRCLSAPALTRFLNLHLRRKVGSKCAVPSDKGIFDTVTDVRLVLAQRKRCHASVPLPLWLLRQLVG